MVAAVHAGALAFMLFALFFERSNNRQIYLTELVFLLLLDLDLTLMNTLINTLMSTRTHDAKFAPLQSGCSFR